MNIVEKYKELVTSLFLLLLGLALSCIYIVSSDINRNVLSQRIDANNSYQSKNVFKIRLNSKHNHLGIIKIGFVFNKPLHSEITLRIIENEHILRISRISATDLYIHSVFPFGFTEIHNSKNKSYLVEIVGSSDSSSKNIVIDRSVPIEAKFVYPGSELFKSFSNLLAFTKNKIEYYLVNENLLPLALYMVPFLVYIFIGNNNLQIRTKTIVLMCRKFIANLTIFDKIALGITAIDVLFLVNNHNIVFVLIITTLIAGSLIKKDSVNNTSLDASLMLITLAILCYMLDSESIGLKFMNNYFIFLISFFLTIIISSIRRKLMSRHTNI